MRMVTTLFRVGMGAVVSVLGLLVVRYPERSYAIRTAWKHDDPSLSDGGRRDQIGVGLIVFLIGLGIIGTEVV